MIGFRFRFRPMRPSNETPFACVPMPCFFLIQSSHARCRFRFRARAHSFDHPSVASSHPSHPSIHRSCRQRYRFGKIDGRTGESDRDATSLRTRPELAGGTRPTDRPTTRLSESVPGFTVSEKKTRRREPTRTDARSAAVSRAAVSRAAVSRAAGAVANDRTDICSRSRPERAVRGRRRSSRRSHTRRRVDRSNERTRRSNRSNRRSEGRARSGDKRVRGTGTRATWTRRSDRRRRRRDTPKGLIW